MSSDTPNPALRLGFVITCEGTPIVRTVEGSGTALGCQKDNGDGTHTVFTDLYYHRDRRDKASRGEVYLAIDGERDYQRSLWNPETTPTGGRHGVGDFLVYMQDYLSRAMKAAASTAEPQASVDALHMIRKVAGLAVCAMEQNGAPRRVVACGS